MEHLTRGKNVKKSFVIVGSVLLSLALVWSPLMGLLVALDIDSSPPVFVNNEMYTHYPYNGMVGTSTLFKTISAWVYEPHSVVTDVTCTVDGTAYALAKAKDEGARTQWTKSVVGLSPQSDGTHMFTFKATNDHGLIGTVSGSYTMNTALKGDWYINDIEITSTDQTLKLTTKTITFKFVPTEGIVARCTITYTGPTSGILDLMTSGYTKTVTLEDGIYSVTLEATDDKGNFVTMTIVGIQIGEVDVDQIGDGDEVLGLPFDPVAMVLGIMGLGCLAVGLVAPSKKSWR